VLPIREWLDNLVFAYVILSQAQAMPERMMDLRDKIGRFARQIYDGQTLGQAIGPDDLAQAWSLRHPDPLLALDPTRSEDDVFTEDSRSEWRIILKARERNPFAFELFRAYHSSEVR